MDAEHGITVLCPSKIAGYRAEGVLKLCLAESLYSLVTSKGLGMCVCVVVCVWEGSLVEHFFSKNKPTYTSLKCKERKVKKGGDLIIIRGRKRNRTTGTFSFTQIGYV